MHDLMRTCIQHYEGTSIDADTASARLWQFFEKSWETATYHFQRSLEIHREFIIEHFNELGPKPGLTFYLCLLLESSPVTEEALNELRVCKLSQLPNLRAESLSVILRQLNDAFILRRT